MLSHYAGQRFDLVQAGGGNSSVKLDSGELVVKASGFALADVTHNAGYIRIAGDNLKNIFSQKARLMAMDRKRRDHFVQECITAACKQSDAKPLIETLLHTLLYRYVLHTHPIVVNAIAARADWQKCLMALFPDALCVRYATPGIDLALELESALKMYQEKNGHDPRIIFLQNHGMIISDNDHLVICQITEHICQRLEDFLQCDLTPYRLTNAISALCNRYTSQRFVAYYSDDSTCKTLVMHDRSLMHTKPFCPDTLVYCGFELVALDNLQDGTPIEQYQKSFGELPKIILHKEHIFFVAPSLRKARDIQDVFKFHLMAKALAQEKVQALDHDELLYLATWDAEKYRQEL